MSIRTLEGQLRAVANARRLGILSFLKKNQSATVGEIAKAVHLHIASASQHLRILKSAGIIEHKKRGLYVTYRFSLKQEEPVKTILSML
ncbi:MAG: metalloregulator ArsR/SmtB family transcription factor [bacterium]|nr:metalloregulator ArsR/SmtB family transcription factor [bacterium]MDA1292769.1 metalloregulator ArsR/SmtB family transcription factor [bacterium]